MCIRDRPRRTRSGRTQTASSRWCGCAFADRDVRWRHHRICDDDENPCTSTSADDELPRVLSTLKLPLVSSTTASASSKADIPWRRRAARSCSVTRSRCSASCCSRPWRSNNWGCQAPDENRAQEGGVISEGEHWRAPWQAPRCAGASMTADPMPGRNLPTPGLPLRRAC